MVLHRDSKWYQQWQEFKDNNPVVTGKVMTFTTLLFSYVPAMIMTDKINAVLPKKNIYGLFTCHIKREMRCFHFKSYSDSKEMYKEVRCNCKIVVKRNCFFHVLVAVAVVSLLLKVTCSPAN